VNAPVFNEVEASALRHCLSLGLATSPLKSSVHPALTQLALLAAWQRCERQQAPDFAALTETVAVTPRYLGNSARTQLARLASMTRKDAGNRMISAALDSVRAAGFTLHPYDYARLEDSLARNAERIDLGARNWLRTIRPEKELPEALYDGPAVDESTVVQAGKHQKIAFASERRSADPAAGRALIERLFPDEPAANRLELLSVLSNHLSGDDQLFLESLTTDRAQTVREKAGELLGHLPGTEAFAKRMARLKEDLEIKTEGLLRRRKVFVYKPPANVRAHEVAAAQTALLSGLSTDVLAREFGETPETLFAMAASSEKAGALAHVLFLKAAEEGNLTILEAHPKMMDGDDGANAIALMQAGLPHLTGTERDRLIRFSMPIDRWTALPQSFMFDLIADTIGGPLPPSVAQPLVSTGLWDKVDANRIEAAAEAVAPLVPAGLSTRFIERFENIAPRAAQYHKFLSTIAEPSN
jgi:Family of unknown function (DUF5691)